MSFNSNLVNLINSPLTGPSNVFSANLMTHEYEQIYQPSKVRMFKNKSNGEIRVSTQRNLGSRRDLIQFKGDIYALR